MSKQTDPSKPKRRKRQSKPICNIVALDDWPPDRTNGYAHREHARWAEVLRFLGFDFKYLPRLVSIDQEQSMRPTFLVHGKFWFHCCKQLSEDTKLMASAVASKTELPVAIAAGRMFVPHANAKTPERIAFPVWFTIDRGCGSIKYFSQTDGGIDLRHVGRTYCTTPMLREAFRQGVCLSLHREKASRSKRVGLSL